MSKQYERLDEATLVRECLQQNAGAQKALYERFSGRMLGVCYRYARNQADAEDMLQEGFIKVFTHLEQYRSDGALEGWIRRIMVTTAINYLKRNKSFQQSLELDEALQVSSAEQSDLPLHTKDIIAIIRSLPLGYRSIVNLYAVEGYSHKEIGDILGIAESTSRSQYARARGLLMRLIEERKKVAVIK
ncbi:sigma-70 family RNA polymerase sigma factor [Compostibacter hankyongensis]|uniref:Sigma-70 family RNA polymerase sigma factor n=1 Tax=Compostibacter hankyongensis TaxID=1007089 RepID=A0ABP8FEL5_9BACT